jgi:AraC-like DNA-binding protein
MTANYEFGVINLYQCEKGFCTDIRSFDYHYILYVHKGKGIYKIGSKKYKALMGDTFYCPPHVDNTIIADQEDPFLLSGLEYKTRQDLAALIKPCSNILNNSFLTQCIKRMIDEYIYRKKYSQQICDSILAVLVNYLIQISDSQFSNEIDIAGSILEYIVSNTHRNVTHKELSEVFSYHKNSINRILADKTGLSLKKYQIELRIKKASELLKYSNKSVNEIAEICGYNNLSFFSKQFKQKTGYTPLSFRYRIRL